jgi:hypothetical protein
MSEETVFELEQRLGFTLPSDYRQFLVTHSRSVLDPSLVFREPRSGVIDILLTTEQILENDSKNIIGIPEKSLMHIGSNIMGGYLYLGVSKQAFGEVHYMEQYQFRESFPSFAAFLLETEKDNA